MGKEQRPGLTQKQCVTPGSRIPDLPALCPRPAHSLVLQWDPVTVATLANLASWTVPHLHGCSPTGTDILRALWVSLHDAEISAHPDPPRFPIFTQRSLPRARGLPAGGRLFLGSCHE